MSTDSASVPLLTVEDVRLLMEEADATERRLEELRRKLDGIKLVLGEARFQELFGKGGGEESEDEAANDKLTWPQAILDALREANAGLTYAELREYIRGTELAEGLYRTPNSFFNAIKRLERHDAVVRHGTRVYLPELLEADPSALIDDSDTPTFGGRAGAPGLVLRVLEREGTPLMAGAIVTSVLQEPEAPGMFVNGHQSIYGALSRMVGRELERLPDGRYRIQPTSVRVHAHNLFSEEANA